MRGEYGVGNMEDFHPHPVDLEKRGVFLGDQESVIFCWFSKTENGWASCFTNQSLRRFSANSSQLRTRFEMRQRPRVWHAQGHEGPAEKFRRRIVSNAQPPPGFSNWDAFAPCKMCFGLFQPGDNFPIFAYCELSNRQKRFGCVSNDRQLPPISNKAHHSCPICVQYSINSVRFHKIRLNPVNLTPIP